MDYQKIADWQKQAELKQLLDLGLPPKELFYQGEWEKNLFKNCAAVVGSRRMTEYGRQVIEKLIPQLIFEGKTIVSGFMYGADQYAHKICLDNGGKTIAVLGWGINVPLSGEDKKLAGRIVDNGGLLLSEWEAQKSTLWTFPQRNRIVAALCSEVFIIEAAIQSGSLITARLARGLKRKVWAVPGPITSKTSAGTNNLIAAGQAQMWLGAAQQQSLKLDDPVLTVLENEALSADELARKLNKPVAQVGAQLSLFLLSGQLAQRGGKYYLNDAG
ncbi:MAG: DNA-protecting protein DprA [Patescibacteria group bacterium]|nr:DNA-protecting protein DprA [Patescibacteria group bacterium]MCL5432021.1 DNA-protecting protein DprA [Patescibacteria group bacterium]